MKEHEVKIRVGEPGNHRQQGIVERFNRTLAERIFKAQYHEELKNNTSRSKKWIAALPKVIKDLNGTKTKLLGRKPVDPIILESINSKPSLPAGTGRKEIILDTFDVVRYLYLPSELEGGSRATWSLTTHHISEVGKSDGIVLYRLGPDIKTGNIAPRRSFVREELLKVDIEEETLE